MTMTAPAAAASPESEILAEKQTRRRLLDSLKQEGPQGAAELAAPLGITAMAVRQHLYALEAEGLVANAPERRGKGRPVKLWRLTPAADRFFPDGHAELTTGLLAAMREVFGDAGLEKLMAARSEQQAAAYRDRLGRAKSLKDKLVKLAAARTDEGYMAAVERGADGAWLLVENHCPICSAAAACSGLCAAELDVFRRVLGPEVEIERTDHILAGARRCAYRVTQRDG